jgi:hypothetical protein
LAGFQTYRLLIYVLVHWHAIFKGANMDPPSIYKSYLLRLWTVTHEGEPTPNP